LERFLHGAKLALSPWVALLCGGNGDEHPGGEVMAWENKSEFEQHFREMRRSDVGDEADGYTELDMVTDLCEDGWPDACGWMQIFMRIHDGGELTPREREQALAYWNAGEELPADDMRLPPCGPACQRDNRE
jgi:hypothetical protein